MRGGEVGGLLEVLRCVLSGIEAIWSAVLSGGTIVANPARRIYRIAVPSPMRNVVRWFYEEDQSVRDDDDDVESATTTTTHVP